MLLFLFIVMQGQVEFETNLFVLIDDGGVLGLQVETHFIVFRRTLRDDWCFSPVILDCAGSLFVSSHKFVLLCFYFIFFIKEVISEIKFQTEVFCTDKR